MAWASQPLPAGEALNTLQQQNLPLHMQRGSSRACLWNLCCLFSFFLPSPPLLTPPPSLCKMNTYECLGRGPTCAQQDVSIRNPEQDGKYLPASLTVLKQGFSVSRKLIVWLVSKLYLPQCKGFSMQAMLGFLHGL